MILGMLIKKLVDNIGTGGAVVIRTHMGISIDFVGMG